MIIIIIIIIIIVIIIVVILVIIVLTIPSLRAFRPARDSEAKGRVDWQRSRWPEAKFEVPGAKCDLSSESAVWYRKRLAPTSIAHGRLLAVRPRTYA